MASLLDTISATVISGFIILMMVRFNSDINQTSIDMLSAKISQSNAIETSEVIEYDLYKIGYKISGEKINIADSTDIKFYSDLDNNDVSDSIRYYIGTTSDLSNTTNPNDKPVYRKLNNNSAELVGTVISLHFDYLDSTGLSLNYSNLTNTSEREKIKSIILTLGFESTDQIDPSDSVYRGVDIYRVIRPKNLIY